VPPSVPPRIGRLSSRRCRTRRWFCPTSAARRVQHLALPEVTRGVQRRRADQIAGDAPALTDYNRSVITRGIREFVARDWAAVRASKDAYWAARIAQLGPLEAFRVSEELRLQARVQAPSWPDEASRRDDLRAHVRLVQLLRRADSARRA
jgi:hypothetical protein